MAALGVRTNAGLIKTLVRLSQSGGISMGDERNIGV
jgi:hypothetical protein